LANHFCEFAGFELDYTKYPQKEQQYQYFRTYFSTFYGSEYSEIEKIHRNFTLKTMLEKLCLKKLSDFAAQKDTLPLCFSTKKMFLYKKW
jgi:gamma-glutamylcysteine synthetase